MKILIVYASESGTCRECADIFERALSKHEVTKYDVTSAQDFYLSPSDFDACAVGGPIRYGKLHKGVRKYIDRYKSELQGTKSAYFIACGYTDQYDKYLKKSIPKSLRDSAVCCELFGGRLKPENAHGLDKLALKVLRSSIVNQDESDEGREGEFERVLPEIVPENVKRLAKMLEMA